MFRWKTPYLEFVYWIESAPRVDSKERETNIYTIIIMYMSFSSFRTSAPFPLMSMLNLYAYVFKNVF